MDEQAVVSLVGQLGTVGVLVLVFWRAWSTHSSKMEAWAEKQTTAIVELRTEVRTLVEVLSDGNRRLPRLRTAPGGYPTLRTVRDTEGGDDGSL